MLTLTPLFVARRERFNLTAKTFSFERDRTIREILSDLGKSTRKRLRSLSPVKHSRKSLEGMFGGLSMTERGQHS